jgi:uncharacterized phage protein (TIGR01671 family)
MREIKFRAWDEQNKILHRDFQFIKTGDEGNDWIIFVSDKQKLDSNPHAFQNPHFSGQFKISQYTGLKDKHNKEIYEDDIVDAVMHEYVCDPSTKYLIEYRNAGFYLKAKNIEGDIDYVDICGDDCCIKSMEIIGNKHENPELLDKNNG